MRSDAIRSTFSHVVYPYNEKQNGLSVLLSESSLFKGAKNEKYDQNALRCLCDRSENDKYITFHLLMRLYITTNHVRSVCIIPLILYHVLVVVYKYLLFVAEYSN